MTSLRDKSGEFIGKGHALKTWGTYGVAWLTGKALLLILCFTAPVRADNVTILALGDSLTQGYGLVESDGFVPQLEMWLKDSGATVELVNGGVSGDTTSGAAARVAWSLTPDIDAMIVTLGGNDLLRGIDPALSRSNLDAILQTAKTNQVDVLLVGMRAPGNYGPEYAENFNAIYPELAKIHGVLLHPYFFSGLGEGSPDMLQDFFQADGIHPNAEGVLRIVQDLGPAVLQLIEQIE